MIDLPSCSDVSYCLEYLLVRYSIPWKLSFFESPHQSKAIRLMFLDNKDTVSLLLLSFHFIWACNTVSRNLCIHSSNLKWKTHAPLFICFYKCHKKNELANQSCVYRLMFYSAWEYPPKQRSRSYFCHKIQELEIKRQQWK